MNVLACDVGLKRIGLSTLTQGIILPLPPIIRINRNQAASALDKILHERDIAILVIGLPSGDTPKYLQMQARIRHFIALLCFKGEKHFVNEDCTSLEALDSIQHMKKQNKHKAQKDGRLDSISACMILERYIQSLKEPV
ncbi:Holliday junction resolvase RuvX [Helicobacter jaachi]|uniref:Putative pre-16S rRNA nuclease n=1 Tax=Helicobacter jaachi TaxID=1677920 RepID=A0A4U8TBE5_9HELI|nr:Holliday junction resolvase RuvX [Helicobacter jaachi]TLD97219.1 Holliday junction resolvase RuvX [Helicobacter jaachi]